MSPEERIAELEAELATMGASRAEAWKVVDELRAENARLNGRIDGLKACSKAGFRSIARAADQAFDSLESRLRAIGIPVDTRTPEPH